MNIVKYPLVYPSYFLFIFPFENKGVEKVFTKSIFFYLLEKNVLVKSNKPFDPKQIKYNFFFVSIVFIIKI